MKTDITISKEDLRRALGIGPRFNITGCIVAEDGHVKVTTESSLPVGYQGKQIEGVTEIVRAINKSIESGKELMIRYETEHRGTENVSTRRFLPTKWFKENETIDGIDLEVQEPRRFSIGKIEWVKENF